MTIKPLGAAWEGVMQSFGGQLLSPETSHWEPV